MEWPKKLLLVMFLDFFLFGSKAQYMGLKDKESLCLFYLEEMLLCDDMKKLELLKYN